MAHIEVFDNFGALDSLIQVIYHSFNSFVLISEVGVANWDVQLGLVEENQWWKASWSTEDVIRRVKKPTTARDVENLAQKLAGLIISGELSIKGWSDNSRPKNIRVQFVPFLSSVYFSQDILIKLTIGADVEINLQSLPEDEGSMRGIRLLKKIALRAQPHNCQLFKSSVSGSASSEINSTKHGQTNGEAGVSVELFEERKHELEEAQKRIKELEGQISLVQHMIVAERETTRRVAPQPPPGSSRANPTKQKRKIVEAEFESD